MSGAGGRRASWKAGRPGWRAAAGGGFLLPAAVARLPADRQFQRVCGLPAGRQTCKYRPCHPTSVSRMPARLKSRMDLMETREEANAGKANPTARLQPNKWGCAVSSLCWGGRRPAVQPRSGQPCAAATALPAVRAHAPGSSSQPDDAPAERQRARPDDPPARTERRRSGRPASSKLFRQLAAKSGCC